MRFTRSFYSPIFSILNDNSKSLLHTQNDQDLIESFEKFLKEIWKAKPVATKKNFNDSSLIDILGKGTLFERIVYFIFISNNEKLIEKYLKPLDLIESKEKNTADSKASSLSEKSNRDIPNILNLPDSNPHTPVLIDNQTLVNSIHVLTIKPHPHENTPLPAVQYSKFWKASQKPDNTSSDKFPTDNIDHDAPLYPLPRI